MWFSDEAHFLLPGSGVDRILKSPGPLIQLQHYTGVRGILVPGLLTCCFRSGVCCSSLGAKLLTIIVAPPCTQSNSIVFICPSMLEAGAFFRELESSSCGL